MMRLTLKITLEHKRKAHMEEIVVRAFNENDNTDTDIHNINSFVEVKAPRPKESMHYHFKQLLPFDMEGDVWYKCEDYDITSIEIELQKEERY